MKKLRTYVFYSNFGILLGGLWREGEGEGEGEGGVNLK